MKLQATQNVHYIAGFSPVTLRCFQNVLQAKGLEAEDFIIFHKKIAD